MCPPREETQKDGETESTSHTLTIMRDFRPYRVQGIHAERRPLSNGLCGEIAASDRSFHGGRPAGIGPVARAKQVRMFGRYQTACSNPGVAEKVALISLTTWKRSTLADAGLGKKLGKLGEGDLQDLLAVQLHQRP